MAFSQLVRPTKQHTANEQILTLEQSLSMVSFLVETGIGCITYLRGMFPDENFVDDRLQAPKSTVNSNSPGVKVKKLKRGFSTEADKILDYLELGVQDALKHSYLKTLSFAVFLDRDEPQNIVECYTFNFSYYEVEYQTDDGKKTINLPEVQVEDSLRKLHLSKLAVDDGEHQKTFSVNELKKQVQSLIRNLITATQSLSELPRRRFMTFKLEYVDGTPDDYEPPLFKPLEENFRWLMGTESSTHLPDEIPLGRIDSKFHGVSLKVISVNTQMQKNDHERQLDLETTDGRHVFWDVATLSRDGQSVQLGDLENNGGVLSLPKTILPNVENKVDNIDHKEQLKKLGIPERVSSSVDDLGATQPMITDLNSQANLVNSNDDISLFSESNSVKSSLSATTDGDVMFDIISNMSSVGSLSSDSQEDPKTIKGKNDNQGAYFHIAKEDMSCECGDSSDGIITIPNFHNDFSYLDIVCCNTCDKWAHISCHGYLRPSTVPSNFCCFSCRVKDITKSGIPLTDEESQVQATLANLGDLALFRRAIALIWSEGKIPDTISKFAERLGVDLPTATGIHKRLVTEELIEKIKNKAANGRGRPRKFVFVANKTPAVIQAKTAQYFNPSRGEEKNIFDRIPLKSVISNVEKSIPVSDTRTTNQNLQDEPFIGFTRAISMQKDTALESEKRGREESVQFEPRKKARFSIAEEILEVEGVE